MLSRGRRMYGGRGSGWKGWRREWNEMPQYVKVLVTGAGTVGGGEQQQVALHVTFLFFCLFAMF